MKTIVCIVGARPNFMKVAPIMRQFALCDGISVRLAHTGQHYDESLSGQFFRDLEIRAPEINLNVGSGSHAVQTGRIMAGLDEILDPDGVDAVLVVGDVNSTLAGALVAAKKCIPVIHVESGLRSFDRTMPEEINRILTDRISDVLFVTEQTGVDNLLAEGIAAERIRLVGNVMIDSLFHALPRAIPASRTLSKSGLDPEAREISRDKYALLTLHRPSNVDDPQVLGPLLEAVVEIADEMPVIFPAHPRTRAAIDAANFTELATHPRLAVMDPLAYFEMVGLLKDAALVLTDSGGLQEESAALGIPCLTLRENTERPITVAAGTNTIVGNSPDALRAAFLRYRETDTAETTIPDLWDGRAAERIVAEIVNWI
ncbi:MAG: UDP-N-acetylglucosamine 2-epimerase (non-hydrolyzing) [Alphaproteobacteria bacterium]